MAELIERQLNLAPARTKISNHALSAILGEWARGKLTTVQALDALQVRGRERLTAAEQTEAQNIVNLVLNIPVAGSATAIADGRAQRALKIKEITDVFDAMDWGCTGYQTPAEIRAKLGIPA